MVDDRKRLVVLEDNGSKLSPADFHLDSDLLFVRLKIYEYTFFRCFVSLHVKTRQGGYLPSSTPSRYPPKNNHLAIPHRALIEGQSLPSLQPQHRQAGLSGCSRVSYSLTRRSCPFHGCRWARHLLGHFLEPRSPASDLVLRVVVTVDRRRGSRGDWAWRTSLLL